MYKAVFIDIDGTLLKSDHTISETTITTIQKLKQKNILVVLVSARPLSGILSILERTGLLDNPVASLNGAYISNNGKIIFNSIIDVETAGKLHIHLQNYKSTPIYYQQDDWFSEKRDISIDKEQKITSIPIIVQSFNDTVQTWGAKNTGPNKILVIADAKVINEIQINLDKGFAGSLNICTSKPTFLEIMNIKASKSNAIKLITETYNIKQEETIAIGDNFNDKEMIAFAGMGIAMGNAPDEVKAVANYITDTNNRDGVAKALRKFIDL